MAKKKGVSKVPATPQAEKKAIRLELPLADHKQVERSAKKLGLNLASYCRMAVLRMLEHDKEEERRKAAAEGTR